MNTASPANVVVRQIHLLSIIGVLLILVQVGSAQITGEVTFRADMSEMLASSWFETGTDWLSVPGSSQGWSNSEPMIPDPSDTTIYQWSYEITDDYGAWVEWKFKAFPDENWLNGGWEPGMNRGFTFVGDSILPAVKPNIIPASDPIDVDATVRFTVDMTEAVCWYTGEPFPLIESVWLAGSGGPLNWPIWDSPDTAAMVRLYDNGTNGDQLPGDAIWSIDLLMPGGTPSIFMHKYGAYYSGVDTLNAGNLPLENEAGWGVKHVGFLDTDEAFQVLPTDDFGVMYSLGPMRLHIDRAGATTARISWAPVVAAEYRIWRSILPFPDTSGSPWQTLVFQATHVDVTEGVGDESINYFYISRAGYAEGSSDPSNKVGEWDYDVPTP